MKKSIKNKKRRVTKHRIWLFSAILGDYAPTLHPLKDTDGEARAYAKKNLKLPENLSGKGSFTIRPETAYA